jgi:hypothetical protein
MMSDNCIAVEADEHARLKRIEEAARDIPEHWDWWREDPIFRGISTLWSAIEDLRMALEAEDRRGASRSNGDAGG